ncbi:hypothetical protein [Rhodobacter sp. CZR27]|uniref:hypothetical protein n=1 Tax=Rhodobacter sp. CZR27 TaxID=2033869 RepID=UPI000BBEE9CA|nr:hypothetical protein [Rhodobacter sp. CZR27]
MDFLTFEDREQDLPALMLLAVSLHRTCPKARLHLPARDLGTRAQDWLGRQPNVVLHRDLWAEDTFWNIKPYLIEQLLARGIKRITWLDADLILTADPSIYFRDLTEDTILIAQEGFRSRFTGTGGRTIAIGRAIARELGYTVNSCVVGVTARHLPLLDRWKSLLRSNVYQVADRQFIVGDQDILGGLLGSAEFGQVPVKALRTGRDIAHDMLPGDFGFFQRIATLRHGEPRFVHAQGRKTWRYARNSVEARSLYSQLSLHRQWAKCHRADLPADHTAWIIEDGALARAMLRLLPRNPSLRGLPIGLIGSALNLAYILRNKLRRNPTFHVGQMPDGDRSASLT